jgi:hypothetical protein
MTIKFKISKAEMAIKADQVTLNIWAIEVSLYGTLKVFVSSKFTSRSGDFKYTIFIICYL